MKPKKPNIILKGHYVGLSPNRPTLKLTIECEGEVHTVVIRNGQMTLKDHKDVATIEAFTAFGAKAPACFRLLEMWRRDPAALLRVVELLPMVPEGVYNYLDINTAHITENDANILSSIADGNLVIDREHGWWIWVDVADPEKQEAEFRSTGLSNDFLKVLETAVDRNCFWLLLDSDGETLSELPIYEW
jgi:hypothetical protein